MLRKGKEHRKQSSKTLQLRYSSPPPSPACWPCSACPLPGALCRASSSAIARVRAVMACAPSMVAPSGPQCGFPVSPSSCPILHAAPRGWPADRGARRSGCPLLPTLVRAGTPFGRWAGDLSRTRSPLPRLRRNALRVCGPFLRNRSLTLSLCSLTLALSPNGPKTGLKHGRPALPHARRVSDAS